jgi:hypothetical protein
LILLDTTNAKYLWRRIPKAIKDRDEQAAIHSLNDLWGVGKQLTHQNFAEAFHLIENLKRTLEQDSE